MKKGGVRLLLARFPAYIPHYNADGFAWYVLVGSVHHHPITRTTTNGSSTKTTPETAIETPAETTPETSAWSTAETTASLTSYVTSCSASETPAWLTTETTAETRTRPRTEITA